MLKIEKINSSELEPLKSYLQKYIFINNSTDHYVIRKEGKIIALTGIMWKHKKAIFKNHFVYPEHRRNGYYKRLLDYSIELCKKKNIGIIEANCTPMSVNRYLQLGAKIIKKFKMSGVVKVRLEVK